MQEVKHWQDRVELSFDNRQIFLLFFAGAVVISLVFALGLVVGKRYNGEVARPAATDPLALLDQMGQDTNDDDLTFHEALIKDKKGAATTVKPAAENPAVLPAASSGPAIEEKGAKRAESEEIKPTMAQALSVGAASVTAKEKPAREVQPIAEKSQRSAPPELAQKKRTTEAEPARAASTTVTAVEAKAESGNGNYTLQLSSFQARTEADQFIQKLQQQGLHPHVIPTPIPGRGTWYRVRLGRFKSWEEAVQAKQNFEQKQQVIAYVMKQ
jgi:DedD protein